MDRNLVPSSQLLKQDTGYICHVTIPKPHRLVSSFQSHLPNYHKLHVHSRCKVPVYL